MGIELTRYEFKDELTSANLNAKQVEIQNYLNQAQEAVNKVQGLIDNLNTKTIQSSSDILNIYKKIDTKIERKPLNTLSVEDLNNANFPYPYEASTSQGHMMGLPSPWVYLKYFRHDSNDGHGLQIAYKLSSSPDVADMSKMWTMAVRNSDHMNWSPWEEVLTTRRPEISPIADANLAVENGKTYYCTYQKCANIPYSDDDGIIQVFAMDRGRALIQVWHSWHHNCICFRTKAGDNWKPWQKISTQPV